MTRTKEQALEAIWHELFSKDGAQSKVTVLKILTELETNSYNWGVRQGMFRSINVLTEQAEKQKL
jgi:hypothetical protein